MALTLSRWIMGVTLACAVATTVLAVRDDRERRERSYQPESAPSRAVARVHREYALTHQRWRSLARRDSIVGSLVAGASPASHGPEFRSGGGIAPQTSAAIERLARRQWSSLGIDSSKSRVVVAVVREHREASDLPSPWRGALAFDYLLPPSAPAGSCVAVIVLGTTTDAAASPAVLARMLGDPEFTPLLLGPCAFYARFGEPGTPMERWLASRGFDLAFVPDWTPSRGAGSHLGPGRPQWRRRTSGSRSDDSWTMPGEVIVDGGVRACLGGDVARCEGMVLSMTSHPLARAPRGSAPWDGVVRRRTMYDARNVAAVADYLSDLATYVGPERFAAIWGAPSSVATAMADVTGMTIGDWTREWLLAYGITAPQVGAEVGWGEMALILVSIIASLGIAVTVASRRQVG